MSRPVNDPPRRPRAPGTDNTLPPARPTVVAAEETDPRVLWQAEEREAREAIQAAQRQRRRASKPDSDPPPPSAQPPSQKGSIRLPHGTPWWGYLLLAAISSGAGGGIVGALRPSQVSAEQVDDLRNEMRRQSADLREIRDHLRQQATVDRERWDLAAAVICKLNGSAWVRGVDCDVVDFEPLALGVIHAGPKFHARAEWPHSKRPP